MTTDNPSNGAGAGAIRAGAIRAAVIRAGAIPEGAIPGEAAIPGGQENGPNGKKILQRIAQETGGRYFEAKKKDSVDDVYARSPRNCARSTCWATRRPKTRAAATTPSI